MEARGALHPILPRVWAVGHPMLPPLGREFAAIMYLGRDAVISHRSAAIIWGILAAEAGTVEATIIGRDARRRPGLKIHRVALLDRRDVRIRDGIPTTSPARILLDLAAGADDVELHGALVEARVQNLVSDRELGAAMDRCPLRTGVARLRALLSAERGPALTRSEAERGLRALIDAGRLPRPRFNVRVHGLLVDGVWDGQRLVVEVDGFGVHGHRSAFETDRRRDQTLVANGYVVVRVTWRQLTGEPMAVLARLSQALAFADRRTDA